MDNVTDDFQNFVLQASLFLPEKLSDTLEDFLDIFYSEEIIYNETDNDFKRAYKVIDKLFEMHLYITFLMRDDLGIDVIDKRLKLRTHRNLKPHRNNETNTI